MDKMTEEYDNWQHLKNKVVNSKKVMEKRQIRQQEEEHN